MFEVALIFGYAKHAVLVQARSAGVRRYLQRTRESMQVFVRHVGADGLEFIISGLGGSITHSPFRPAGPKRRHALLSSRRCGEDHVEFHLVERIGILLVRSIGPFHRIVLHSESRKAGDIMRRHRDLIRCQTSGGRGQSASSQSLNEGASRRHYVEPFLSSKFREDALVPLRSCASGNCNAGRPEPWTACRCNACSSDSSYDPGQRSVSRHPISSKGAFLVLLLGTVSRTGDRTWTISSVH